MTEHSIYDIDFDQWATLASTDPQKFEQMRQDKITALIAKAPVQRQHRLRGLQWQIDIIREKNKDSAIASCLAISELMWDTFEHLSELLQLHAESGLSAPIPQMHSNIIAFPANNPDSIKTH